MAWIVLAEGTPEEFEATPPSVTQLSKGTRMRLEMTTAIPIAPLFDLWGAEWVASFMIDEAGARIVDVEGIGWNKIAVHMVADPVWVWIAIGAICAVCGYFGWQLFKELRLFAEVIAPAIVPIAWGVIALIAAAITIPLVMGVVAGEKAEA